MIAVALAKTENLSSIQEIIKNCEMILSYIKDLSLKTSKNTSDDPSVLKLAKSEIGTVRENWNYLVDIKNYKIDHEGTRLKEEKDVLKELNVATKKFYSLCKIFEHIIKKPKNLSLVDIHDKVINTKSSLRTLIEELKEISID